MNLTRETTICIITQSHLCRNPRVLKEATTLAKIGYKVQVLISIFSPELLEQDRLSIKGYNISLVPVSDLTKRNFHSLHSRALHKMGRLIVKYLKFETPLALGYSYPEYLRKCLSVGADLYICHQELATYIGTSLIKKGFKVAFDFEDWYSEDLLPDARAQRPIQLLKKCESTALKRGIFSITTSMVLAKKLAQSYSCPLPQVIYNVFPLERALLEKPKEFNKPIKLFWFSQTIGPGRGLESFILLLKAIRPGLEIHLLGCIAPYYREQLSALTPGQHSLFFHEMVSLEALPGKIAEFDIGLALEAKSPMSRNLTITNKFFQYLQSGLPLIASGTAGQDEGFELFKPGFRLSQQPLKEEIAALEKWLNDPDALQEARQRAIAAAKFYNWENESKKLAQTLARALENGS